MRLASYQRSHKQKWYEVVGFYTEPEQSPHTSKEGKVFAKFAFEGDAWLYAQRLLNGAPDGDLFDWALLVVR